jgi:hypothetical protein
MEQDKEAFKNKIKEYFKVVNKVLQIQEDRIKALEIKNGMAYVAKKNEFKVPGSANNGGRPEVCIKEGSNQVPSSTESCKGRDCKGSECPTKVPCNS